VATRTADERCARGRQFAAIKLRPLCPLWPESPCPLPAGKSDFEGDWATGSVDDPQRTSGRRPVSNARCRHSGEFQWPSYFAKFSKFCALTWIKPCRGASMSAIRRKAMETTSGSTRESFLAALPSRDRKPNSTLEQSAMAAMSHHTGRGIRFQNAASV
jgi:hypothetical protein